MNVKPHTYSEPRSSTRRPAGSHVPHSAEEANRKTQSVRMCEMMLSSLRAAAVTAVCVLPLVSVINTRVTAGILGKVTRIERGNEGLTHSQRAQKATCGNDPIRRLH